MSIEEACAALEAERRQGRCWQIVSDPQLGWIVSNYNDECLPMPGWDYSCTMISAVDQDLSIAIKTALEE